MVAATAGDFGDIDTFDTAVAATAGDCGDSLVVYHSMRNKFGSNLCFVYGRFIMIYHSILNKFGSNLCFGYGEFIMIYHSILNKFGFDIQYGYGEFLLIYHSILNTLVHRSLLLLVLSLPRTQCEHGKFVLIYSYAFTVFV